jgi:hypothetical protein
MRTTVKREYFAKKSDIPTVEEQNARRNQMRQQNYKFGTKGVMNFNTLYNRQFNKQYKGISLAKTKQELVEDALKLRASNIVLGTDNPFKMSEF